MPAAVVHNKRVHPVLCIPELVSQIQEHLVVLEDDSNTTYNRVAPCLLVNRLWHNCGASIAWRSFVFERRYEDFVRFSNAFTGRCHPQQASKNEPHSPPPQTTTSNLFRLSLLGYFFPYTKSPPPPPPPEQTQRPSNLLTHYQQAFRSLTLRKLKNGSLSTHLEQIGYYASRLERLEFYICDHLKDHALMLFAQHGQLTHLSLAGCHRITDNAVQHVAKSCPRLEYLDVRACGKISDTAISAVAHHCRLLKHLNVGRVRERERITPQSILLVAKYTQVTVLGLAGCDIDDACMIEVARKCGSTLERISLNSCPRISNKTLRACATYCVNLSVLELKECHQIDDWELVSLLQCRRKVLVSMCDQQECLVQAWTKRQLQQGEVPQISTAVVV